MIVVGFDTATDDTVVAATRETEVLHAAALRPEGGRPHHATHLLEQVERAAAAAGGWRAVDRIAVGIGPGSFTGLRIGIATARALAAALDLDLVPVATLEALARGAMGVGDTAEPESDPGRPVLAALDARRGEVFAALYGVGGESIWEPFVCAPEQLRERVAELGQRPLAVGSGALRFRDELQEGGAEVATGSHPGHRVAGPQICAIGELGPPVAPADVAPIYLRPPDAERWRDRESTRR